MALPREWLCALEPTSSMGDSGYQDKAAAREDAAASKVFHTSRVLYAVLITVSSGDHCITATEGASVHSVHVKRADVLRRGKVWANRR